MTKTATLSRFGPLLMLTLLTGCATQTLFESNFSPNALGQPPSQAQEVGTASVSGDAGSVVVVALPGLSNKWVEVGRAATQPGQPPSPLAIFQGNFVQSKGAGTYYFSAFLYIPSGSNNVATVQFDQFGWPVSDVTGGFLHLDFMPDNRVRIDDNTPFGTFPRDQVFIVQVTLNIGSPGSTAHVVLSGAGASGERDYTIISPALKFGAVKLWMGYPWTDKFDTTQIVVTYRAP